MTTVEKWFHGLVGGIIGGTSASGLNWLTTNAAHSMGVDVPLLNWKAFVISLATAGMVAAFTYLQKSPLPEEPDAVQTLKPSQLPPVSLAVSFLALSMFLSGCASTPPPSDTPAEPSQTILQKFQAALSGGAEDFSEFILSDSGANITEAVLAGTGEAIFIFTPESTLSAETKHGLANELWSVSRLWASLASGTTTTRTLDAATNSFHLDFTSEKYAKVFDPVNKVVALGVSKLQGFPKALVAFMTVCSKAAQDIAIFAGADTGEETPATTPTVPAV